jgi:type I restriction enzyme S subunit
MHWSSIEFPETIRKPKIGRENQILSAEIQLTGRFPVIDQGQAFIAGYSDAEERVIRDDLPLIVFGDHTRCVKYVDFPFILGADGTKVMKPKEDLFDAKFFYYALLSLDIANRGYNRHFTLLKEKTVCRPEKDEQRKIAAVLGLVQRAIEQQERLIALTTELKKALLHKLFTEGLRGEPQKQTEIGPLPQGWEITKLGSLVNLQTGKLNSNAGTSNGEFPFFTCSQETFRIDQYAFDTEAILLSGNNAQGVYSVKHYKGRFNAYQRTYVITLKVRGSMPYSFLHHALSRNLERLRSLSIGTSTKYLTLGVLQNLPIPKPKYEEAERIGQQLEVIETKIANAVRKKNVLMDLFRTLLYQLMTAQIRVNNLDLSEPEVFGN